jgi:hypothetical protein
LKIVNWKIPIGDLVKIHVFRVEAALESLKQ